MTKIVFLACQLPRLGLLVMALVILALMPARAATERTYVSATGTDAGGCSITSPCLSISYALTQTSTTGIITCLNSLDNAQITTIAQSVTIDCAATSASESAFVINGAGIVVTIRNLTIFGFAAPGIDFLNGAALYVENCVLYGNTGSGILFRPTNVTVSLHVTDSVLKNNGLASSGGGIIVQPSGSGAARVVIERTKVENNTYGIFANGMGSSGVIIVHIKDSIVTNSAFNGISAYTAAGASTVSMTVDRSSSLLSGADGILAQGPPAFVFLANSTVMSNITGLHPAGGSILSYQNNQLTGNATDGAPTGLMNVK